MKLRKSIAISESGFVFNPATGDSFSVNPVGVFILMRLKEEQAREEIIGSLLEQYEVEKSRAEEDLDDFLGHLKQISLIENG